MVWIIGFCGEYARCYVYKLFWVWGYNFLLRKGNRWFTIPLSVWDKNYLLFFALLLVVFDSFSASASLLSKSTSCPALL